MLGTDSLSLSLSLSLSTPLLPGVDVMLGTDSLSLSLSPSTPLIPGVDVMLGTDGMTMDIYRIYLCVDVMLGTDGMTMDMVQEHKFAYLLHKNAQQNTGAMSGESFEMLRIYISLY
ncbi:hypothetical protein KIPB_015041, partial [Kipferlia bialata]|eukprot:g15041.t1